MEVVEKALGHYLYHASPDDPFSELGFHFLPIYELEDSLQYTTERHRCPLFLRASALSVCPGPGGAGGACFVQGTIYSV